MILPQLRQDRILHWRFLCVLVALLQTPSGCAGQGNEVHVPAPPENHRYLLVERDGVVELQRLQVEISKNPFVPWIDLLIECGDAAPADDAPRWPARTLAPDAELKRRLFVAARSNAPPWNTHRDWIRLMQAARRVNPELVQSGHAWLVGSHPLVLAYRDASPDAELYRGLGKKRG